MQDCSIPSASALCLVQDCSISIADALEIPQSCTKPSIYSQLYAHYTSPHCTLIQHAINLAFMPRCLTFWRSRTGSVLMNFSWNLDLRYYFKISYPIFLKRSYQINISMQIRGKFSLTFQWNMRCRLNSFFMRYVDCYNFEVALQRWSVIAHKILWLPFKFTHTAKIDCIWTQLALVKTRDDIADNYFNKRSQIWANSLWMLIKDVLSVSNHLEFTFSVHFMIFAYLGPEMMQPTNSQDCSVGSWWFALAAICLLKQ